MGNSKSLLFWCLHSGRDPIPVGLMEQNRNDTHALRSLSGTKMYKGLENTKLMVSLFLEKQRIKSEIIF